MGAARARRSAANGVEADALLVRRVAFGEADVVATFFTASHGIVATVARGARRASKRFASLEPVHLLRVAFDDRPDADLVTLREAAIAQTRSRLTGSLPALEAAGVALRWVRRGLSARAPEPSVFRELNGLLDDLDALDDARALPGARTAAFGLRLLADLGWGLELERCASCGKPCAGGASAFVDAARGGLVCRGCGGGPVILRAAQRARLVAAAAGDDAALTGAEDAAVATRLVEDAFAAHTT